MTILNEKERELKTSNLFDTDGLGEYLGKKVTIFGLNYIYHGTLVALSPTTAKLSDASIVYETGDFKSKEFKDVQSLCTDFWNVERQSIESFGTLNKK
jgi:hypothetical protein